VCPQVKLRPSLEIQVVVTNVLSVGSTVQRPVMVQIPEIVSDCIDRDIQFRHQEPLHC
jgi:hypothetical protein